MTLCNFFLYSRYSFLRRGTTQLLENGFLQKKRKLEKISRMRSILLQADDNFNTPAALQGYI